MKERMCACLDRERKRKRERDKEREIERKSVCICVCVCVREKHLISSLSKGPLRMFPSIRIKTNHSIICLTNGSVVVLYFLSCPHTPTQNTATRFSDVCVRETERERESEGKDERVKYVEGREN